MRGARSSPSNLRARLWAQGRGTYGARRARTPPPRGEAGTPEIPGLSAPFHRETQSPMTQTGQFRALKAPAPIAEACWCRRWRRNATDGNQSIFTTPADTTGQTFRSTSLLERALGCDFTRLEPRLLNRLARCSRRGVEKDQRALGAGARGTVGADGADSQTPLAPPTGRPTS